MARGIHRSRKRAESRADQERGGGQPAISPWALVPQELIHPLVPLARFVSNFEFGNTAAINRCTWDETKKGMLQH